MVGLQMILDDMIHDDTLLTKRDIYIVAFRSLSYSTLRIRNMRRIEHTCSIPFIIERNVSEQENQMTKQDLDGCEMCIRNDFLDLEVED
jgi:hypothetical protein